MEKFGESNRRSIIVKTQQYWHLLAIFEQPEPEFVGEARYKRIPVVKNFWRGVNSPVSQTRTFRTSPGVHCFPVLVEIPRRFKQSAIPWRVLTPAFLISSIIGVILIRKSFFALLAPSFINLTDNSGFGPPSLTPLDLTIFKAFLVLSLIIFFSFSARIAKSEIVNRSQLGMSQQTNSTFEFISRSKNSAFLESRSILEQIKTAFCLRHISRARLNWGRSASVLPPDSTSMNCPITSPPLDSAYRLTTVIWCWIPFPSAPCFEVETLK